MEGGATTAFPRGETEMAKEPLKERTESLISKSITIIGDEESATPRANSRPLPGISREVDDGWGMQRKEARFVELGFPDAKMTGLSIQYDIDGIQGEGLAWPEAGTSEQSEDGLESNRQKRAFGTRPGSGPEESLDLFRREQEGLGSWVAGEETQLGDLCTRDYGAQVD
jgi:hypothetical protein